GWLFSPDAKPLRRLLLYGIATLALAIVFVSSSAGGWGLALLMSVIAFVVGFCYWLGGALRGFTAKPTTFGSAEWATGEYLLANKLVGEKGINLGRFKIDGHDKCVRYDGDRHLLTIAPTRAGKGTTTIIPNLLTYGGSALVVDPKGENA